MDSSLDIYLNLANTTISLWLAAELEHGNERGKHNPKPLNLRVIVRFNYDYVLKVYKPLRTIIMTPSFNAVPNKFIRKLFFPTRINQGPDIYTRIQRIMEGANLRK